MALPLRPRGRRLTTFASPASVVVTAQACGVSGCPCARAAKAGHGLTHCPAHADGDPSLNVSESRGVLLVHCHTGCAKEDVIEALKRADLWPASEARPGRVEPERFAYSLNGRGSVWHVRLDKPGQRKMMWWERPDGKHELPEGVAIENLPLYRVESLAERPDELVLFLEGEKKTELARAHGFLAVSLGGGAAQRKVGTALQALAGRDVVLLPDNDLPGRDFMRYIAGMLGPVARSARILELPNLPPKGDLVDYFEAGGTDEGLRALLAAAPVEAASPSGRRRPAIISAPDLLKRVFLPQRHIVAGMLSEGAMILAGKPKLGKTWLQLGLSLAVAAGGKALGQLDVDAGDVLCMPLEDGERRAMKRLEAMLGGEPAPARLSLAFEWSRVDDGGVTDIGDWLTEHPAARLVVIDTLKRIRPEEKGGRRLYDLDYDAVAPLADLGKKHHVCILIVHHTRKADADDPMDTISGSTGLTGSVDGSMLLRRARGAMEGELMLAHRDLEDQEWALRFEQTPIGWVVTGSAEDARRSNEQKSLLRVIASAGDEAITSRELGQELNKPPASIRRLLTVLRRDGVVEGTERGYRLTAKSADLSTRVITPITRSPPPDRSDRSNPPDRGDRPDRTSNEETPCPNGCGITLRDGWCPVCGKVWRDEELQP